MVMILVRKICRMIFGAIVKRMGAVAMMSVYIHWFMQTFLPIAGLYPVKIWSILRKQDMMILCNVYCNMKMASWQVFAAVGI